VTRRPRLSRSLLRFAPALTLVAGLAGGVVLVAGCGKERVLASAGGDCDLAIDCLPGLVCLEEKKTGRRICSSDLTSVQGVLPPDGGGAGDASDAGDAQILVDGEGEVPRLDGGRPPPPPQDSGSLPGPQDAAADG
jgi:hypothetical protein